MNALHRGASVALSELCVHNVVINMSRWIQYCDLFYENGLNTHNGTLAESSCSLMKSSTYSERFDKCAERVAHAMEY